MNDYKQVYKNVGTAPRTMGEAYRNADYATPIHRYNTEHDDAVRFLKDFGISVLVLALLGAIAYNVYQIIPV